MKWASATTAANDFLTNARIPKQADSREPEYSSTVAETICTWHSFRVFPDYNGDVYACV